MTTIVSRIGGLHSWLRFPALTRAQRVDFQVGRHASTSRRMLVTTLLASTIYMSFIISDATSIPDIMPLAISVRLFIAVIHLLTWPVAVLMIRRGAPIIASEIYCLISGTLTIGSLALFQAVTTSPNAVAYFIGYYPTLLFFVTAVWTRFIVMVMTITSMTAVGLTGLYFATVVPAGVMQGAVSTVVGTAFIAVILAYRREVDERTSYLLRQELKDLSDRDALTQLPNRRSLEAALQEWDRSASSGLVAMVDVDNFKALNDQFGHPEGDVVLRDIAAVLREALRETDCADVMRYGGEEFTVIVPGVPEEGATLIVERLRAAVEHACPSGRFVTVSIGWSWSPRTAPLPAETMMKLADDAVLLAKRQGRNRAIRWAQPTSTLGC